MARNMRWCLLGAALVLQVFLLPACDKDKEYGLAFSHSLHVKDNEMACTDCHGDMKDGQFKLPDHSVCSDCHDEVDAKEISEKTCGMCHKVKSVEALAPAEQVTGTTFKARGIFVHTKALAERCTDCHGNLLDKNLKHVPEMTQADRVRIRNQAHTWGMACDSCHVGMDPQIKPTSHDENWIRRHGVMGSQPDNACKVCHEEQSCRECHQTMMPSSHNNLWRLKTHGIQAAWDRARCQVCHEEDSCVACHSEVRPQSHNASWRANHCFQCHPSEATGTGCALCHEDALDSHPNPHPAGWRTTHCQSCHPGTPAAEQCDVCHRGMGLATHPNPHPAGFRSTHCNTCHGINDTFNGVTCSTCHGGDALDDHPDPHSAGWRSRHCFQCHIGPPQNNSCVICHDGGNSVLVHEGFWPPVHNRFGDKGNCYDCHGP